MEKPKHPSTNEWIMRLYTYTNRILLNCKENEIMKFTGKWVELDSVTNAACSLSSVVSSPKSSHRSIQPGITAEAGK